MRFLLLVASILFSPVNFANDDNSDVDITIHVQDAPAADVAELINSKCKGKIEPIVVKHTTVLITLNFELIRCKSAAAVLRDFDSQKRES